MEAIWPIASIMKLRWAHYMDNQNLCRGEVKQSTYVLFCFTLLLEESLMETRRYTVPIQQEIPTRYPSDRNDQEFELFTPHVAQKDG
jgi:hypothetical protein